MWPEGITCLKELSSEWSNPSVSILSSSLFSGPIKATDHCALLAFVCLESTAHLWFMLGVRCTGGTWRDSQVHTDLPFPWLWVPVCLCMFCESGPFLTILLR